MAPQYKDFVMHRKNQRFEVSNKLQGESLVRKGLFSQYKEGNTMKLAPELNVIKIGGHGIIDYGKNVVLPLCDEIKALKSENKMLIVTGGGVRVRHVLDIGLDLGMPSGILAELSGKISEQNAIMMSVLLSSCNAVRIHSADLLQIPYLLSFGALPIMHGTPPYGLYEYPARSEGGIPPHRTDTGAFLAAEVIGAKSCIYVKNVDGLFTKNPFVHTDAELIPRITATELLEMDLEDLVIERKVIELLCESRNLKEIKIINGHIPGELTKAVNGEKTGSVITAR